MCTCEQHCFTGAIVKAGLWTLDWTRGLDYRLDYGLDYRLDYRLDYGLSFVNTQHSY